MKPPLFASLILLMGFAHPFQNDLKQSLAFLKKEKATVLHIKNTSYTEGSEALSIVAPELMRWSAFQDFFETKADEILYVQKGAEAANFSIGHFQMKPHFVEQLEEYVANHTDLATFSYVVLKEKDAKESRRQRIERLKRFDWQLRYAHVYWLVAKDKFKNRHFPSIKERVTFFATAYNYGFMKPEAEIEAWQKKKAFPYGIKFKGEQAAFSDFATAFFEKYACDFDE